jgi:Protein of unknown function, DUF547
MKSELEELFNFDGMRKIQNIVILVVLVSVFMLAMPVLAEEPSVNPSPEITQTTAIDYDDYNNILEGLVLSKGVSSRAYPDRVAPPAGTRISFVSNKSTRLEANRVMFHVLRDEDENTVHQILLAMAAFPDHFPLSIFNPNEQLAYWLNLRNLAVLDAIAQKYPIRRLKQFWQRIENEKNIEVQGSAMSINDIEALVLSNWPNALVIYGFYNGAIGGPNIRERAFSGANVWTALEQNAREFTNSLRGIQFFTNTAKISDFYTRYPQFFPNFESDVVTHMSAYLSPVLSARLETSEHLETTLNDWYIADLMNGRVGLSSTGSNNPGALVFGLTHATGDYKNRIMRNMGRLLALDRYPAHALAYLRGRQERINEYRGTVTIEEVAPGENPRSEPDEDGN